MGKIKFDKQTKLKSSFSNKVILIGNLPHELHENQLNHYLSQYGNIFSIRFLYSKRFGTPKHHAFIEFEWATVAEIVAAYLDSYILHENSLFCRKINSGNQAKNHFPAK